MARASCSASSRLSYGNPIADRSRFWVVSACARLSNVACLFSSVIGHLAPYCGHIGILIHAIHFRNRNYGYYPYIPLRKSNRPVNTLRGSRKVCAHWASSHSPRGGYVPVPGALILGEESVVQEVLANQIVRYSHSGDNGGRIPNAV